MGKLREDLDEKNADFRQLRTKCRRLISQGNHNTVFSSELCQKLGNRSLASTTFDQALLLAGELEEEFTRPLYITKFEGKFFVSFLVSASANCKKSGITSTQTGKVEEHLEFYNKIDTAWKEKELYSFCVLAYAFEKLEMDGTAKYSQIIIDADLTEYKETLNSRSRVETACS